jgi:hypothetical protein
MSWNPLDWFTEGAAATAEALGGLATGPSEAVSSWFQSTAGDIASGFEGAAIAILGDVWDVIVGPLEVIVGAVIIILVIAFAFRNQLIQLGGLAMSFG